MDDDLGAYCDREKAHPRAVSLMVEDFFWNPMQDDTPFGSDEGSTSYQCWREWRADNPTAPLSQAIESWILGGDAQTFLSFAQADNPQDAFYDSNYVMDWDLWTLNVTIITTALSQLLDEGTIDGDAKDFVSTATTIERNPLIETPGFFPAEVLDAIDRVVAAA